MSYIYEQMGEKDNAKEAALLAYEIIKLTYPTSHYFYIHSEKQFKHFFKLYFSVKDLKDALKS